jgi:hypothetical protein
MGAQSQRHIESTPLKDAMQRWIFILWPGFLLACALEAVVFAAVDPAELRGLHSALGLSPIGVYTLAFFIFWAAAAASSWLTLRLAARDEAKS